MSQPPNETHDKAEHPAPTMPGFLVPIARFWTRVSAPLVPVLAVVTALLAGIPLMIITGGQGNIPEGLRVSGVAYAALIEGSTGLAINNRADLADLDALRRLADAQTIEAERLTRQARPFEDVEAIGIANVREYRAFLQAYPELTPDEINAIAERLPDMDLIGEPAIREAADTLSALADLDRSTVRDLAERVAGETTLSDEQRSAAAELWPALADFEGEELTQTLNDLTLIDLQGQVTLQRHLEALQALDELGIALGSDEAQTLRDIYEADAEDVLDSFATLDQLDAVGITRPGELGAHLRLMDELYDFDLLSAETINEALASGALENVLKQHLVILRPGDQVLIGLNRGDSLAGVIDNQQGFPVAYAQLFGGQTLLFLPANLERTFIQAIPYIIAGLAVALAFKGGLFNIGAEGQLHVGAIFATWVGFSLTDVPGLLNIPVLLLFGILGGFVWGAIPGLLKAFTGAHEVINTIMLNFIGLWLVDWLIKSQDPLLMGDPTSSQPKTPDLLMSARLPTFDDLSLLVHLLAGVAIFLWYAWEPWREYQRGAKAKNGGSGGLMRVLARPLVLGVLTSVGSFSLMLITVRGQLHLGFALMLAAVLLVDWFLKRTTPGFELQTVGINQKAARYAGMNVSLNVVLAMALAGALAGLAGAIEVSGNTHVMFPALFAGYGFDAIAVALLARTNPRNMIWAGLLWGGLLSGAAVMQARAGISRDLVAIVQALIIMFVAADQIIRYLWRVRARTEDEKLTLNTGWGS